MDYFTIQQYFLQNVGRKHKYYRKGIRCYLNKIELDDYIFELKEKKHIYLGETTVVRALLLTGMNFLSLENIETFVRKVDLRTVNVEVATFDTIKELAMLNNTNLSTIVTYYINITLKILRRK